jgi:hypothetical protein
VIRVIDVKCPGSGESDRMHWPNLESAAPTDEVKFVIRDRGRLRLRARSRRRARLIGRCAAPCLFSPVHGVLERAPLAEWILADGCRCGCSCRPTSTSGIPDAGRLIAEGGFCFSAAASTPTPRARCARADGYELYALTIRYGQVHDGEVEAARRSGAALGVPRQLELDVPLSKIGGSALVGDGEIPKDALGPCR